MLRCMYLWVQKEDKMKIHNLNSNATPPMPQMAFKIKREQI